METVNNYIKLIECPRDAMQGIHQFIPTDLKVEYLNALLKIGFHTLDFGSFVSPKAIPQMADTAEVVDRLDWNTSTKLLAIVANLRGAEQAATFDKISYLGFPFSISETFQQRNTNIDRETAFKTVIDLQNLCAQKGKELVVYLSMGFGNPYGDAYSPEIVAEWATKMVDAGVKILALSDTIGVSNRENIEALYQKVVPMFNPADVEIGVHLHSNPYTWLEKIDAAFQAGCLRFDSAMLGLGGCPMAKDDLTGNIATENLMAYLQQHNAMPSFNEDAYREAFRLANKLFNDYH